MKRAFTAEALALSWRAHANERLDDWSPNISAKPNFFEKYGSLLPHFYSSDSSATVLRLICHCSVIYNIFFQFPWAAHPKSLSGDNLHWRQNIITMVVK
jgi:hypothetical protein